MFANIFCNPKSAKTLPSAKDIFAKLMVSIVKKRFLIDFIYFFVSKIIAKLINSKPDKKISILLGTAILEISKISENEMYTKIHVLKLFAINVIEGGGLEIFLESILNSRRLTRFGKIGHLHSNLHGNDSNSMYFVIFVAILC